VNFNEFIERWLDPYRAGPNYWWFKNLTDEAKRLYKFPVPLEWEVVILTAMNDPRYSKNGLKKLYSQLFEEHRQKIVDFFLLPGDEMLELIRKHAENSDFHEDRREWNEDLLG